MATGIPHWEDDPEAWDTIKLEVVERDPNGKKKTSKEHVLPGIWDVEDGNVKRIIEIKKGPGRDGATIKDQGMEPGQMRFVGQLQSDGDWTKLQAIWDLLIATTKGKARDPVKVTHPKLSFLKVDSVLLKELSTPTLTNGIMTVTISAIEYVEKPKKTGKKKVKQADALDNEFFQSRFHAAVAAGAGGEFNAVRGIREDQVFDNKTTDLSQQEDARAAAEKEAADNALKTQQKANSDFYTDQQAGKVPKFNSVAPQYSPK